MRSCTTAVHRQAFESGCCLQRKQSSHSIFTRIESACVHFSSKYRWSLLKVFDSGR